MPCCNQSPKIIIMFRFVFFSHRFMNGQPQPWSPDTSRLIIDTRAENQTIFVFNIGYSDAGNYTCVLRNATHKSEHRIELKVIGTFSPPSWNCLQSPMIEHLNEYKCMMLFPV